MKLKYSRGGLLPNLIQGEFPFAVLENKRIRITSLGRADHQIPSVLEIGELLLSSNQDGQIGATLLLDYHLGNNPPYDPSEPQAYGKWYPTPSAPIFGQLRIALSLAAMEQIKTVDDPQYSYEISLSEFVLINEEIGG